MASNRSTPLDVLVRGRYEYGVQSKVRDTKNVFPRSNISNILLSGVVLNQKVKYEEHENENENGDDDDDDEKDEKMKRERDMKKDLWTNYNIIMIPIPVT